MNQTIEYFRGSIWQRDDLIRVLPKYCTRIFTTDLRCDNAKLDQQLRHFPCMSYVLFRFIFEPTDAASFCFLSIAVKKAARAVQMLTEPIKFAAHRLFDRTANVFVLGPLVEAALKNAGFNARPCILFLGDKTYVTHIYKSPQKRWLLFGCSEKAQAFQNPVRGLETELGLVGYKREKEHGSNLCDEGRLIEFGSPFREASIILARKWCCKIATPLCRHGCEGAAK
ncbi:MAG: hypothetical protein AAGF53_07845 [Pseudomonadota bacterium]